MKNRIIIFLLIILSFSSCRNTKERESSTLNFQIINPDINNFWNAIDNLKNSKDSVGTLNTFYFDKASPEFKEFIKLENLNAKVFVNHLKSEPKFWKTVRPLTKNLTEKKSAIDSLYMKMKKIYPDFKPPNICFAISGLQSGGTTSKNLILIGSEIAVVNPKYVDISEINGFFYDIFKNSKGDVMALIAHELIHTQQPLGDNSNSSLLSQAIIEGAADFLCELIYGKPNMNKVIFDYGEKHEKELWREFKTDIEDNKSIDNTDWFYNYHSNRPPDLGYYIGYKIVKSYYDNQINKKKAVKEIIEMKKPKKFLIESKYER